MKEINTPVLFLIYKRPEHTKRVFNILRKIKIKNLYIAGDGPKNLSQKEIVENTRKITEKIDWKCNVKRLYRKKNLGCKLAVSSAIDWFFDHEDEGIIIEDDCLPDETFFNFCSQLLTKYRNNENVMHISGNNFLPDKLQSGQSYYFSKYSHIWGWATWKRAWKKYDVDMNDWRKIKNKREFNNQFPSIKEKTYWHTLFNAVSNNKIDTWDYQWLYAVLKNGGVCINPNVNVVENIGFDKDSTHTKFSSLRVTKNKIKMPLSDVEEIKVNLTNDKYIVDNVFKINLINIIKQYTYYTFIK